MIERFKAFFVAHGVYLTFWGILCGPALLLLWRIERHLAELVTIWTLK
jgi:hypothetical protein